MAETIQGKKKWKDQFTLYIVDATKNNQDHE